MQTFLPYPDFTRAAAVLDLKRLGKQRVEVVQIVRALTVPGYAWRNHPAALMWEGYEEALGAYGIAIAAAWCGRGFSDTCAATIRDELGAAGVDRLRDQAALATVGALPPWLGDAALHRSHQSALVRKDPQHYRPIFPDVADDLPSVWPVRSPQVIETERRRAAAAIARDERLAARAAADAEKAARRRSRAAKKAARTRKANARRRAADG